MWLTSYKKVIFKSQLGMKCSVTMGIIVQVVERLRSCEAACELLEKYNMSYQTETNWMDELDSKLRNLEELEEARAKEAWEKHVVSNNRVQFQVIWVSSLIYALFLCDSTTLP